MNGYYHLLSSIIHENCQEFAKIVSIKWGSGLEILEFAPAMVSVVPIPAFKLHSQVAAARCMRHLSRSHAKKSLLVSMKINDKRWKMHQDMFIPP